MARAFGGILALGLVVLAADAPAGAADHDFVFFHEEVLGTSLELGIQADSEPRARAAEARALAEIERLRTIFSTYDPASELSRFLGAAAGEAVRVAPELAEVFARSDHWRRATGGAFDPRAAALTVLWKQAAAAGRPPTEEQRRAALAQMAPEAWRPDRADPAGTTDTLRRLSSCPLTLDAIAKGFIAQRACAAAARGAGVRGVLLNLGGDLRAEGAPARSVAIAPPRGDSDGDPGTAGPEPLAVITVRGGLSVATSGNARRGFTIGARRFSHILDPRTGLPAEAVAQATVIAPDGADADALATAFNVMEVPDALRLADETPDVACLIVTQTGRILRSRRWSGHELPPRREALARVEGGGDDAPGGGGPSWGDQFELAINFEINRPPDSTKGYRRPYVVVWAEDETGRTVRTLVYWVSLGGQGPDRWLPDLSRWYRDDPALSRAAKKNMVFTTARPTRPPGKYNIIWDGKDAMGRPLPPGRYTVSIEAAREHGTHQLLRQALTLADQPFVEELPGDVEIKSATLSYRRKPEAR